MEYKQYKIGFLRRIFSELTWEDIRLLEKCKEKCEKLVVGVLTDELYLEICGQMPVKSCEELKAVLLLLKAVDDVVFINKESLNVQISYEQIGYNCLFVGSEYGENYENDCAFFEKNNIEIVSVIPEKIVSGKEDKFFSTILENAFIEGKIVLFGTGVYFEYYMRTYGNKYPPAYAVDNNQQKWGTTKDNILIQNPEILKSEKADDVLVVLCCREHDEIKKQVLELGIHDYRTLRREWSVAELEEYQLLLQKKKKYKVGFLMQNFNELTDENLNLLQECKKRCEKLIVGLPENDFLWQLTDVWPAYEFPGKCQLLQQAEVVDEIVPITVENISICDSYEQIRYDVYFYGGEYGRQYKEDKEFLAERGVAMISMAPKRLLHFDEQNAMRYALQTAAYDRKIILFGTGKYFEYYMENYGKQFPPIYAVDNDSDKWNTRKQGVLIQSPEVLKGEDVEKVIIILCCREYKEILQQIWEINSFNYRTLLYNQYLSIMEEYRVARQEEEVYIKKAHEILMKLIKEFDRVCRELDLHYYVISGSLIGVVRHQGLIPWDDDIDVAMSHHDYKILKEKAKVMWKDKDFLFLDYDEIGKDAFYDFMTRVVYLKEEIPTGIFRKVRGKAREDIMNRMVLDIYVLEDTFPGVRHKIVTTLIKGVYALAMGHRGYVDYDDYGRLSKNELKMLKLANRIGKVIPLKLLFALYEGLRGYAKNKNAKHCFESNGVINYMPWIYEKQLYGDGTRLPMNDIDVMVPADYHGLLKAKGYGNYMEYPPAVCRKPSHMAKTCGVIW